MKSVVQQVLRTSPLPINNSFVFPVMDNRNGSFPRSGNSVADMRQRYKKDVRKFDINLSTERLIFASPYSNVYRTSTTRHEDVCVKALRALGDLSRKESRDKQITQVMREMTTWVNLRHTNILPLLGYCELPGEHFIGLVSEWKQEGHILRYIGSNPNPEADKLSLLIGCANGLSYLHNHNVVHSDLKCQNVLITLSSTGPIPLICDFGTSRIIGMRGYTTRSSWGTQGFLAPELEEDVQGTPTRASDVWSFAVMAYQLFTEREYLSRNERFGSKEYPGDVRGLTPEIWNVLTACWCRLQHERPPADRISQAFRIVQETGTAPGRDWLIMRS
ncbi:hypothetical protein QCA50_011090 [Cerrena zonata]|uniref:Protein kinase domain-containing protein n=1 Tax=Cerrena zonata TaxID=2478898 RepID=A0AAW0G358_9APHY